MKPFIKTLLRENLIGKEVSTRYLSQLLNHVNNKLAIKFINGWIKRGKGDMVTLSAKEANMLTLIQQGGPKPSDFHPRN